tara:strand:- start:2182 stop:2442 length:261 start_codon:yes stop_codon:yes gene_type:complete
MESQSIAHINELTDYWRNLAFFEPLTKKYSQQYNMWPRESQGMTTLIKKAFKDGYKPRAKQYKNLFENDYKKFKNLWWKTMMTSFV